MVIQTEVTLQADYVLSACDGGKIPHCRNCYLINLPAYPSLTIVNTSCVNLTLRVANAKFSSAHVSTDFRGLFLKNHPVVNKCSKNMYQVPL